MNRISVDVIIPVYKPDQRFAKVLERLQKQTVKPNRLIIINTESEHWKSEFEQLTDAMEVYHIEKKDFDHGGTRAWAAKLSTADALLFMTQDAVPADTRLIEELIKAMESEEDVRAAYARQLPAPDCHMAERYTRAFNYPSVSSVKRLADLPSLGIKTYFCSNVCALYDRKTYEALGGFAARTIFNEDMIYAAGLIQAGYGIAYAASARVIHSHNYSALMQFHRNFDLAVSQADHPEIFKDLRSEGEGIRLVRSTASWLCKKRRPWLVIGLIWNSGWKYLGYLLGKQYRKLPKRIILRCTMNAEYWKYVGLSNICYTDCK